MMDDRGEGILVDTRVPGAAWSHANRLERSSSNIPAERSALTDKTSRAGRRTPLITPEERGKGTYPPNIAVGQPLQAPCEYLQGRVLTKAYVQYGNWYDSLR